MIGLTKWILPTALCLVIGFATTSALAQQQKQKPKREKPVPTKGEGAGTISGKLVDKDGKAVAGARVSVIKPMQRQQRRERRAQRQDGAAKPDASARKRRSRPEPVATTTTDNDGKFIFKDIASGTYALRAQLRGQGTAMARVTVAGGKTADVAMALKQGPGGKPGAGPEQKAKRDQRKQDRQAEKKPSTNQP